MTKNPTSLAPKAPQPWSLIGAGIHVMDSKDPKHRTVARQGQVVAQHGDRILVLWFSWVWGLPTYATWHSLAQAEAPANPWRFFETLQEANDFYRATAEPQEVVTGIGGVTL